MRIAVGRLGRAGSVASMITLRTPELQAASIPDNCAEAAGDVDTYAVKPRRTDVKVQLVSVGSA